MSKKSQIKDQYLIKMPATSGKSKDNKRLHSTLSPESPNTDIPNITGLRQIMLEILDNTGLSSLHSEIQKSNSAMHRELN
jgi:hypothetical protein